MSEYPGTGAKTNKMSEPKTYTDEEIKREKPNYWSNDGSVKWTSALGTIIEVPYMGFKAMPNGCEFFAFFARRIDAMEYVKENAK